MKAIIIDDEKKGRTTLEGLLNEYCPAVQVVASAGSAEEGFELIGQHQPHLVFLDIEMPQGNGFSLLDKFNKTPFYVIFTTAHENYAIQAIRHNAFDYLLKPIDIDDLKEAVEKVQKALQKEGKIENTEYAHIEKLSYASRIALPVKEGTVYLQVADIIRIESDGSYSLFFTVDHARYIVSKNIGEYEHILPEKEFFRVHKSHLVNIRKVKKYIRLDGYFAEMEDGSMIEISRRKKEEFLQSMTELQ